MKTSIQGTAFAAVTAVFTVFNLAIGVDGAGLKAAEYQGCYSSSYPLSTNSSLTYEYQSSGWCQEQCGTYNQKAVFGLTKGNECWCGDKLPANSTKVSNDQCDTGCYGYGTQMCGGDDVWTVYTSGLVDTDDVESVSDSEASSAASASGTTDATATTKATNAASQGVSTITQAGTTIYLTPTADSSTSASPSSSSGSSGSGTNKAGIAAGVVVGIVAIAAIAGGVFFYMRHKKRKAIEQDFQRQQSMNQFTSGTVKSERSTTDSRLDPAIQYRRQSDGSIADDTDFSRRVLKVTNPDRQA
ncbi:putative wsc domain containing protein [Phaeomoniella chlamydospora]|uniref:Putative wsc domain containing protein n=1 Tax=Phaeomoniella chlamydospora TaxID=158046 RepID=A0A0G2GUF8_PHACM|nr:putative wsc domain containing protein [Phaeomoniella chlamydospora]